LFYQLLCVVRRGHTFHQGVVGAYAEYALASAAMISRKPASLTFVEAASVPVIAVTAWQALFDQARVKATTAWQVSSLL
jgi:NADPH:quinone reductase-like Zn-dependent oxidoreductase